MSFASSRGELDGHRYVKASFDGLPMVVLELEERDGKPYAIGVDVGDWEDAE